MREQIRKKYMAGGLKALSPGEKQELIEELCRSYGLDPLLSPITTIWVRGFRGGQEEILYATKAAADAIRRKEGISEELISIEYRPDMVVAIVRLFTRDGQGNIARETVEIGASPLTGDPVRDANAVMRAVTKAKRRGALSWAGLSLVDESELETMDIVARAQEKEPEPKAKPLRQRLQPEQVQEMAEADTESELSDEAWAMGAKAIMTRHKVARQDLEAWLGVPIPNALALRVLLRERELDDLEAFERWLVEQKASQGESEEVQDGAEA